MIILGMYLAQVPLKSLFTDRLAFRCTLIRLIVIPLLTIPVLMVFPGQYELIKLAVLIAAPEGLAAVLADDPDIHIYTCAIDECLNENAYIVPGLGDAGDRIFGTL